MNVAMVMVVAWVCGGLWLLGRASKNHGNENSEAFVDGLRRAEPAAISFLIIFLSIWPAIVAIAAVRNLRRA